jgi:dUTP pyrophosphatase
MPPIKDDRDIDANQILEQSQYYAKTVEALTTPAPAEPREFSAEIKYVYKRQLKVRKLHPSAKIPQYQSAQAAGFDLSSVEDITIYPGRRAIVPTGLAFDIPAGYELQIRPRSGLAAKHGIMVVNSPGTVDSDYVDEVKVILFNSQDNCTAHVSDGKPFVIQAGDRIAQAVFKPVEQAEIVEVESFDRTAAEKDRGGGFGSTGV